MIWEKDNYKISSEKKHVDIDVLHDMLRSSYWAKNRSREAVEKSVETSLCFSLLKNEEQIGFVRVLTDTMAYAIILDGRGKHFDPAMVDAFVECEDSFKQVAARHADRKPAQVGWCRKKNSAVCFS